MPLLTCPCAFRLRRLGRNAGRGRSVRHFPCKSPGKMMQNGSCEISVCISITQARSKRVSRARRTALFLLISRQNGSGEMTRASVFLWTEIFLWDPVQRASVEISYRHLAIAQRAFYRDLGQQLLQRTSSTEILTKGACRIWPGIFFLFPKQCGHTDGFL